MNQTLFSNEFPCKYTPVFDMLRIEKVITQLTMFLGFAQIAIIYLIKVYLGQYTICIK